MFIFEIQTERMDILVKFCPNIQTFRLLLRGPHEDDDIEDVPPGASISTIGFKNLISLSLYGVQFQLNDGAFLISVNWTSLINILNKWIHIIYIFL